MILQTVPRFAPGAAQHMRGIAVSAMQGPAPAQRARVALQFIAALRAGTVKPTEALSAVADADRGVGDLIHRRASTLMMPQASADIFPSMPIGRALPESIRQPLAELMRTLVADGDLSVEDCHTIAASAGNYGVLVRRLNSAWNRRCERVVAPIRALLPADATLSPAYLVMPGPLVALLQPALFEEPPYQSERTKAEPPDVYAYASGRLIVPAEATVAEPDTLCAVRAAWDAIAAAIQAPFMECAKNGLTSLVGYVTEILEDATLGCTWLDGEPIIDDAELVDLANEVGLDGDDGAAIDSLRAYMRYSRTVAMLPEWSVNDAAFVHWVDAHAEAPRGRAIRSLRALAELAAQRPLIDSKAVTVEYSEEGLLPICMMPEGTGLDGYFEFVIDQSYQNVSEAELFTTRRKDKPRRARMPTLGALLDRYVFDAAIAAAAASVLSPYVPRPEGFLHCFDPNAPN